MMIKHHTVHAGAVDDNHASAAVHNMASLPRSIIKLDEFVKAECVHKMVLLGSHIYINCPSQRYYHNHHKQNPIMAWYGRVSSIYSTQTTCCCRCSASNLSLSFSLTIFFKKNSPAL